MSRNSAPIPILLLLLLLPALALQAQGIDPKKIRLLDPPDLQVKGLGLLSAKEDSEWRIVLQVTIGNSSHIKARASQLRVMVQDSDKPLGAWTELVIKDFPEVPPRDAVYREIELYDNRWVMHKRKRFNLKVIADYNNKVQEVNEDNNESKIITVSKK